MPASASPGVSRFCVFSSPLHLGLTLPKSKIHPILLFRAIPPSAALTADLSPDLLLGTQTDPKAGSTKPPCSVRSMKPPQRLCKGRFSFTLGHSGSRVWPLFLRKVEGYSERFVHALHTFSPGFFFPGRGTFI